VSRETPWWDTAFRSHYRAVYPHRDDDAAAREVAALLAAMPDGTGPWCDACCGDGRHLAALRAHGVVAVGFDFSHDLLAVAGARPGLRERLVRADMRSPPFAAGSFAVVTCLFSAFGYFDDDENAATLAAFAGLLSPGGRLVLDLADPDAVARGLPPDGARELDDGRVVSESRWLDGDRVCKRVAIASGVEPGIEYVERLRLYRDREIVELAARVGLDPAARWPGLLGPDEDQGRAVHFLRKTSSVPPEADGTGRDR